MSDSVEVILTTKPEFFGTNTSPEEVRDLTRGIRQYQRVAGKFNELWREIDARTNESAWRKDGVGSCHTSPHMFETLMNGALGYRIEDLWYPRSSDTPQDGPTQACQFHREGRGCVLGDLKSVRCIDYVDGNKTEIEALLGTEIPDIRTPLMQILQCGLNYDTEFSRFDPGVNEPLAEETVLATQALIDHVRTNPVLHPTPEIQ